MRLTKEDRYGHFYTNKANCRNIWSLDGKKLEGEFFENQTLAIDGDAIDKLGQLEDIEEKLGIDLVTLLGGLLNDGVVWVKLPYVPRDNGSLPAVLAVDIAVETKWSFKKPCRFMLDMGYVQFTFLLKDYGKTWALTKEELE